MKFWAMCVMFRQSKMIIKGRQITKEDIPNMVHHSSGEMLGFLAKIIITNDVSHPDACREDDTGKAEEIV